MIIIWEPGSWAPNWLHGKARMASLPASPPYWEENNLFKTKYRKSTKLADFAIHLQKSAFNCVKVQNRPSFSVSGHWTKELMPWRDRNGPSSAISHVRWYFFSLCFVSIPHLLVHIAYKVGEFSFYFCWCFFCSIISHLLVQGLQLSIVDLGLSSPGFIAFNICLLTQLVKQI